MKEPYTFCWDIQTPTEKESSLSKLFQRWQKLTSFVGHLNNKKKRDSLVLKWLQRWQNHASFVGTLKFQLKNSSVSKWFQRSQNFTSLVGTFKSKLKNTVYYWNDYKDDSPLHSLLAHSSFKWKKLTPFIGTFKIQLEKQFSIQMISKMTEPYIVCGDIQIPTEKDSSALTWFQRSQSFTSFEGRFRTQLRKTVQYWNDYKDDRTLHSLRGHSNSDWQNLTSFVGTFKFKWRKQFSTQMISKVTETYIVFGDTQIPAEKDSSVLTWFQRSQNFT